MEITCTQCGARLPRENARYCNNCGSLLSSRSPDSMSSSPMQGIAPSAPASNQQNGGGSRPPLREQTAQQPPARPVRQSSPDHPPLWMSELERSDRRRTQADPLRMKRSMESAEEQRGEAVPDVSVLKQREKPLSSVKEGGIEGELPLQVQDVADKPTQAHVPAAEPVRRPVSPTAGPSARELRELRVKVWPQEDLAESTQPVEEQKSRGSTRSETGMAGPDTALDDLPTRPLVVNHPTPSVQRAVNAPQASKSQESAIGDVDLLDTTPLRAPEAGKSGPVSSLTSVSVVQAGQVEQRPRQAAERGDSIDRPSLHSSQPVTPAARPVVQSQSAQSRFAQPPVSPVPPVPPVSPLPTLASTGEGRQGPVRPSPVATKTGIPRRAKRSGRTPVIVLLAVLIVGSLAAWIIAFHPFTVPAVTQPRQTFSNTQLGLSVLYPSGWTAKVDAGKGTVIFSDSSHTGQVEIVVSAVSGDLNQYLSKEESQLGMTGVKPGNALSFAGTSWQQVQGSMQVSGANYTAVLLAAVHGSHIYEIIQMAPQVTYTDEDHLIFSSMRSSFHFLP